MAFSSIATAEQVDPRFPAERVPETAAVRSGWLPTRIEQLEAERDQLLKKISVLPQQDFYGFGRWLCRSGAARGIEIER